jgi:O-antigen ligase
MDDTVALPARAPAAAPAAKRFLPVWWPLAPFPGLLVLWLMGLNYLIWPLIGLSLLIGLFVRGDVRVPQRFGIWMVFLALVVISATQLAATDRAMSYGYRFSMYFSATMLLLYIYNTPRSQLPVRTIVNLLAIGWCMVVLGGLLGLVAPKVELTSPMEVLLPADIIDIPLVSDMVSPAFAKQAAFVGLGIHRTQAPFPYPNAWGSNFVLLTPFALWSFLSTCRRAWRPLLGALLLFAIVPFFFSLDRGAWLALALGLLYGGLRVAVAFDVRTVKWFALGAVVLALILVFTPLMDVLITRLNRNYSDEGRIGRNLVAIELAQQRPLLGYGAPQAAEDNPANAAVGTHGQLWLVMVSNGIPALLLYMGWFFYLLVRSGRRLRTARDVRFWPHLTILMAIIMSPYYELMPLQLHTMMVAAAIIMRDGLPSLRPGWLASTPEFGRPVSQGVS